MLYVKVMTIWVKKCCIDLKKYSKWIKLIRCIQKYIFKCINKKINEERTPYFDVVADEVTVKSLWSDCENWKELEIVICYIYKQKSVERPIEYVKCDDIKGKTIVNLIIESLKSKSADISYCRVQLYVGAKHMQYNVM